MLAGIAELIGLQLNRAEPELMLSVAIADVLFAPLSTRTELRTGVRRLRQTDAAAVSLGCSSV